MLAGLLLYTLVAVQQWIQILIAPIIELPSELARKHWQTPEQFDYQDIWPFWFFLLEKLLERWNKSPWTFHFIFSLLINQKNKKKKQYPKHSLKFIKTTCRIIESSELEGTSKDHLIQLPCSEQRHHRWIRLPRAWSSLTFKVCRDGAFTTSLGNLIQCLTTLTVEDLG